jgi:DNA processing protein
MSPPLSSEARDLLTLHLVPGIGPRLTAALLERFGSAAAVLKATPNQLQEVPHIGATLAGRLAHAMLRCDPDAELKRMAEHGVRLLARGQPGYPESLQHIPDPPHLLYVRGELRPSDAKAVALVGSRGCTSYGRRVAERLATGLVHAGYTVVSGLARGIDGAAHRAALQAGGRTLAVLANGLSQIYPPEHAELAREVEAAGALLTEAPMTAEPLAGLFPARNRLISGLSRAVVVIEAAERSGALITARHAGEQGRPVFVVPGPVDSPASGGTHRLARDGAILIRGVEDILEELGGTPAAAAAIAAPAEPPAGVDGVQRQLWELLAEGPRHIDELARALHLGVGPIAGALLMLEMKKGVRRLPGNLYERA